MGDFSWSSEDQKADKNGESQVQMVSIWNKDSIIELLTSVSHSGKKKK